MGKVKSMMMEIEDLLVMGYSDHDIMQTTGVDQHFIDAVGDMMREREQEQNWSYDHLERDHDEPYDGGDQD